MEIFDAIVLNVLRKCNGCKAGLSVLVEGVGSAGWLRPYSRDFHRGNFIPEVVLMKQFHVQSVGSRL
jgi:hypothetical protein